MVSIVNSYDSFTLHWVGKILTYVAARKSINSDPKKITPMRDYSKDEADKIASALKSLGFVANVYSTYKINKFYLEVEW